MPTENKFTKKIPYELLKREYYEDACKIGAEVEVLVRAYQKEPTQDCFEEIAFALEKKIGRIETKLWNKLHPKDQELLESVSPEIIQQELKERIIAYRPRDERSSFYAYCSKHLFHYCLTAVRKAISVNFSKEHRRGAKKGFYGVSVFRFNTVLEQLSPKQAEVLKVYYKEGYRCEHIAKLLGVSGSAVRTTKMVALKRVEKIDPLLYQELLHRL